MKQKIKLNKKNIGIFVQQFCYERCFIGLYNLIWLTELNEVRTRTLRHSTVDSG